MKYRARIFNRMFGYDYDIRTIEFYADTFEAAIEHVSKVDRFADIASIEWLDADVKEGLYPLPDFAKPALEQLADQQGLTEQQVLLQALRLYYSYTNPMKSEPMGCAGDE